MKLHLISGCSCLRHHLFKLIRPILFSEGCWKRRRGRSGEKCLVFEKRNSNTLSWRQSKHPQSPIFPLRRWRWSKNARLYKIDQSSWLRQQPLKELPNWKMNKWLTKHRCRTKNDISSLQSAPVLDTVNLRFKRSPFHPKDSKSSCA